MRAKVILSAAGLALVILAPAIYFRFAPSSPAPDQSAPVPEQVAAAAPTPAPTPIVVHHHRKAAPSDGGQGVSTPDAAGADHEEVVTQREVELTQLGMSDDPADLKTILSELNNKDAGIRSAALNATEQFGSKEAIPALQQQLDWAEDPEEKVEILKAINYLKLPSFDEFTASANTGAPPPSN